MFPEFLVPPAAVFRLWKDDRQKSLAAKTEDEPRPDKLLHGHVSYLRCMRCGADLCLSSQIISKGFTGRHGRAYLVSAEPMASAVSLSPTAATTTTLPNTITQRAVPRQLVTGAHVVSDISCVFCGGILGWKYVSAEEESQRYKVGKFILETKRITTASCWDNGHDVSAAAAVGDSAAAGADMDRHPVLSCLNDESDAGGSDGVEFDSQDEDECEDLFAGIWSPDLATRRRSRKFDRQPGLA